MEIRAAKSANVLQRNGAATPAAPGVPHSVQPATVQRPAAAQRSKSAVGRGGSRAAVLTRDQEYAFIRNDLRRMLILAAVLIVGMIAVLFILESL